MRRKVNMPAEGASAGGEELWLLALAVGAVVVVVVAVLLGLVISALQSIDRHAARTYTAGKEIAQNTTALWTLEQTNRDLVAIRDAARGIEREVSNSTRGPLVEVASKVQDRLGHSAPPDDGRP
jgi:hypothetical protein